MREKLETFLIYGPMVAVILLILVCASLGCQRYQPSYEHKTKKVFVPCLNGGHDIKSWFDKSMWRPETTGGFKTNDADCISVVAEPEQPVPTVLSASIMCAQKDGPFFMVAEVINPDRRQVWSLAGPGGCPYLRLSVDAYAVGGVKWTVMTGKPWSRSDAAGWEEE